MKLATLHLESGEEACVVLDAGYLPVREIVREAGFDWPVTLLALLESGRLDALRAWHDEHVGRLNASPESRIVPLDRAQICPLYRRPRKIWGIGLNYRAHAADLNEVSPTAEPASFMKPDTAIVGANETIKIPRLSQRTTGEAELGIVIGRTCRDVERADWRSVVAGFCPIIDMTAEDILRRNPRNLTQSKSFDTFFSFGPVFFTTDEVPEVTELVVRTVLNGREMAENTVANMTFPPDFLVSYHSQLMTLLPGDIISSGTPGATPLSHGDVIECRISGFPALTNPVVDLKRTAS